MASWRRQEPPRIEGPEWYRNYHPEDWDEPDEQERRMLAGCEVLGEEWVAGRHRMHAERRWCEAKHRYRRAHPQLASQEFDDLVNGERAARRAERQAFPGGSMEP
jgi:hypothetical protein